MTQRTDVQVARARAVYVAEVRKILGSNWEPPAGVAYDDAAVIGLCKYVRTLPGTPTAGMRGFLLALGGHVARFVEAEWRERRTGGRYDPQEALAWLERPLRPTAPLRRPSKPPSDAPQGPQPGRDTTPKDWHREPLETRILNAKAALAEFEHRTRLDRSPGYRYEEAVAFNGATAYWAPAPPQPHPEDTTMPVDEPLDDAMAYDPPAEPEAPLTPLEAQEAIELDELREAARAAEERHRRQVAEVARIEKERADAAAEAMLASLRTLAEKDPDARPPRWGVEVE